MKSALNLCAWMLATASLLPTNVASAMDEAINFNRDVRPILSDKCFRCHGPDAGERKAGLRLDRREDALARHKKGTPAVVPGKPDQSDLIRRVESDDADETMPPPELKKKLTAAEKSVVRRWVDEGAQYQTHWAFQPPVRPPLPAVRAVAWVKTPVDRFILARLEALGLAPSPPAEKYVWLRRVTLDLTGLPPTIVELDAFLADASPQAWEKVVDRLLASPRYAERMALDWLDAARFADTHGYHLDSGRDMTRWRDWVIEAFQTKMPFDRFTVEQLAGDLLPHADLNQRIATGFQRNHMINFEGGAIPEEYHAAYVIDRVNTLGTVWLGLTVGCAQCHDHKYDPISQREYYQFFAFFHNVPEQGLDGRNGNAGPSLSTPTADYNRRLEELAKAIRGIDERLSAPVPKLDTEQAKWEQIAAAAAPAAWTTLTPTSVRAESGTRLQILKDQCVLAEGPNPGQETYVISLRPRRKRVTAIRLEMLPDERFSHYGPGRSLNGNVVLTEAKASITGKPAGWKKASADFSQKDFPISAAVDGNPATGWAIYPEVGKPHLAVFELAEPVSAPSEGIELQIRFEFRSAFGQHQPGKFRLAVTDGARPHGTQALPAAIRAALPKSPQKRSSKETAALRIHYRTIESATMRPLIDERQRLSAEYAELKRRTPNTMVMEEMSRPRSTHILLRGQYDQLGPTVAAEVPSFLPPLTAVSGTRPNRLSLARWLVDPTHPLTARVAVNRYWQMFFGVGLVKTAEDFGSQGEAPSHPELLDWLATEFIRTGWNIQALQKQIVLSATYRQSSWEAPGEWGKDPENRLLRRAPRIRLQAEFLRDQALAVSGLLDSRIGGGSVSPYQPAGLWEELASRGDSASFSAQFFVQSHGADLYRRGMYTFWKRTSPPPVMTAFDAPDREVCTVRRSRTNTPLQALTLLNETAFVEAARKFAERLMNAAATTDDRLTLGFRLATARAPKPSERAILTQLLVVQIEHYRSHRVEAEKLLAVGETPRDRTLDVAEAAGWTLFASTLLNLDETVTRN